MRYAMNGGHVLVPMESPLLPLIDRFHLRVDPSDLWAKWIKPMLAGFCPDEGELLALKQVYANVTTDRGTNLDLGLFKNASPGETITEATLTEPTDGGYARKTLTDGSWVVSANPVTYAQQTFTAGASPASWTSIQGYFIASKGTTPRIIIIEVDSAGPYTFAQDDTYDITLSNGAD